MRSISRRVPQVSSLRPGIRRTPNDLGWEKMLAAAVPFLCALIIHAQDARTVTEPHIPRACITLQADIVATNGAIAPSDEQKLSTARIQSALDHCSSGHAVFLRAHDKSNVFLTGPLTLRDGVTLVIDKNTALVASRDPRLYEL